MNQPRFPTFGEALQYLRDLGFATRTNSNGAVVCEHPTEGSWFVFRDRDPNTPAREIELLDMREQLTGRGFVSDEEYARFWDQQAYRHGQRSQPATEPR